MPPIDSQRFLSQAQNKVTPEARGDTAINRFDPLMKGVVNFTPQTTQIQFSSVRLTSGIAFTPTFTMPVVGQDEIMTYFHLAVLREVNPDGAAPWTATVNYPGFLFPIEVMNVKFDESQVFDMLGQVYLETATAFGRILRYARPITVYPGGTLVIFRQAAVLANDPVVFQYVRERAGGPGSAEFVPDIVATAP